MPDEQDAGAQYRIAFTPQSERVLREIEAAEGLDRSEIIRRALSCYWWMFRERALGNKLLVQRGDEITEFVPKD